MSSIFVISCFLVEVPSYSPKNPSGEQPKRIDNTWFKISFYSVTYATGFSIASLERYDL